MAGHLSEAGGKMETGLCDKCGGPEPCSKRACIEAWEADAAYWDAHVAWLEQLAAGALERIEVDMKKQIAKTLRDLAERLDPTPKPRKRRAKKTAPLPLLALSGDGGGGPIDC